MATLVSIYDMPSDVSSVVRKLKSRGFDDLTTYSPAPFEEIEEAERNNNLEAAANAREELQFLESQISAAFGLRGHPRPVGSPAENARKSVSEAIRRALKNIRSMDSHLGNHLTNSIKTGVYVSYSPESAVDWHL